MTQTLTDEQIAAGWRMETPLENAARDIKEGRFPKKSDPQHVAPPPPSNLNTTNP